MYKTELIQRVAKDTRLSQKIVSEVIGMTMKEITLSLARKEDVVIPGFGTFYTRSRPSSQVKSFVTGKTITIPQLRVAAFRVGEVLKKAVRKGK